MAKEARTTSKAQAKKGLFKSIVGTVGKYILDACTIQVNA